MGGEGSLVVGLCSCELFLAPRANVCLQLSICPGVRFLVFFLLGSGRLNREEGVNFLVASWYASVTSGRVYNIFDFHSFEVESYGRVNVYRPTIQRGPKITIRRPTIYWLVGVGVNRFAFITSAGAGPILPFPPFRLQRVFFVEDVLRGGDYRPFCAIRFYKRVR